MDTTKAWTAQHPIGSLVQFSRFGETAYRVVSPAFFPPNPHALVLLERADGTVFPVQIDWVKPVNQSPDEGGESVSSTPAKQ